MCVSYSFDANVHGLTGKTFLPPDLVNKLPYMFIAYKVIDNNGLTTTRQSPCRPGIIKARLDGKFLSKNYTYNTCNIAGIHVYLNHDTALRFSHITNNRKIVPVICYKKDLLAIDKEQAAFTKVIVPAETWPVS